MGIVVGTGQPRYIAYALSSSRAGRLQRPSGVGRAGSAKRCGDVIEVYLRIAGGNIQQVRYLASGCPGALASAAAVAELAEGKTLDDAGRLREEDILDLLADLPRAKRSCSNLGALALRRALEDYISGPHMRPLPKQAGRAVVAMSGGVDSSVAAALLHARGLKVVGISMRLYDGVSATSCCSPGDQDDARKVAATVGFTHHNADFRDLFEREVIARFCKEYLEGKTPNPCVDCNRFVKFTALLNLAEELGAESLATGHYVRVVTDETSGRKLVKRGVDSSKDQSYMFWSASQEVLKRLTTPLGDYRKAEVRDIAADLGLSVADKAESQEICFVPNNNYRELLRSRASYAAVPGRIVDRHGNTVGKHTGLADYTIGQRRGLGISSDHRLYVVGKDSSTNTLVVGARQELATRKFLVKEANWVAIAELKHTSRMDIVCRYNGEPLSGAVSPISETALAVELSEPVFGLAPGQSVVFYDGNTLIGGGIACESP